MLGIRFRGPLRGAAVGGRCGGPLRVQHPADCRCWGPLRGGLLASAAGQCGGACWPPLRASAGEGQSAVALRWGRDPGFRASSMRAVEGFRSMASSIIIRSMASRMHGKRGWASAPLRVRAPAGKFAALR